MTAATMTVSGNVATSIKKEVKKDGDPWCHFRIACNERYFDSRTNQWSDGETSYFTVICWQPHLAKNVAASLNVGDPIVVYGRGRVREWRDEQNVLRYSIEISANSVGHDLYRGISSFTKAVRQSPSEPDAEDIKQAVADYVGGDGGVDRATGEVPPPPLAGRESGWEMSQDPRDDDESDDLDDSDELAAVGATV